MRILLIKMSSMGDIIHTLPAVTDATNAFPTIQFDWVVEEAFTEIPKWHKQVHRVIPIGLRRWRKKLLPAIQAGELNRFYKQLRGQAYDFVLDAQGSIKSAMTTRLGRGYRLGMDKKSARESLARLAYQKTFSVPWQQHAITRLRQLFSQALNYPLPLTSPHYSIDKKKFYQSKLELPKDYVLCIPNTSCLTKQWSYHSWSLLIKEVTQWGISVFIPWGDEIEKENAQRLAQRSSLSHVLPFLSLNEIGAVIAQAKMVITVDTGFSHLAAALGVPTIVLYGPTNPLWIGTLGPSQFHIKMGVNENRERDSIVLKKVIDKLHQFLTRVAR